MQHKLTSQAIVSWTFGIIVFIIGVLNLILVHPVPGIVAIILSFLFFPMTNEVFKQYMGFTVPLIVKIILGLVIIWFTLGISDLGDMLDKSFQR